MTLSGDISSNSIILAVTSKGNYNNSLLAIYPELAKSSIKVGYMALTKPFNTILNSIQNIGLDKNKFYFVDAITATVQSPPACDNCVFVSAPNALTDLGLAFSSLYGQHVCDLVFIDTISTLIIYQDIGPVTKFVHNLVTKSRVMNKKLVMLALKEDSESLIKDLNMFVDKVVNLD